MKRIYLVIDHDAQRAAAEWPDGIDPPQQRYLVRACSQAQAVGHVVRERFNVRVASQDDLVAAIASGVSVADATTGGAE